MIFLLFKDTSSVLNELCKKIDGLKLTVENLQSSIDTLQGQVTVMSDRQVLTLETLERLDRSVAQVFDRLDLLERQPAPAPVVPSPALNTSFSEEIIFQARTQLNVDLTVPLVK